MCGTEIERRVAVDVQEACIPAVIAPRLVGKLVERRRLADPIGIEAGIRQAGAGIAVVGLVINIVVESTCRHDQAAGALAQLGFEQRAETVARQRAFVEIAVAVVAAAAAAAAGQQRIPVVQARGKGVGGIDAPIEHVAVTKLNGFSSQGRLTNRQQAHGHSNGRQSLQILHGVAPRRCWVQLAWPRRASGVKISGFNMPLFRIGPFSRSWNRL